MRRVVPPLLLFFFLVLILAACGGGNGSGVEGIQTSSILAPTLVSIAPARALAGGSALTLQATGTNFTAVSQVEWNGSALTTTYVSATQLTAKVPASNLAAAGTASVTVFDSTAGHGTSGALTFSIAQAAPTTTWIRTLNFLPNDIAWDSVHGMLLASMPSTDATNPNHLLAIDPVAGTVLASVQTGTNPDLLSISSDASYVWVGVDGDSAVQRYTLPGLQKDISISLPIGVYDMAQAAVSLEAARVNPHTLAVVAGVGGTGFGSSIYVYDDAVQRPAAITGIGSTGGLPLTDWVQWGKDDSVLYGTQYDTIDSSGGVYVINVSSSGVARGSGYSGFQGGSGVRYSYYVPSNGLIYNLASVADPVLQTQVGRYYVDATGFECVPDSGTGRFFCVTAPELYGNESELWVFGLASYDFLERVDLSGANAGSNGYATGRIVRWGKAGLALIGTQLILIDGTAINPSSSPDTTAGTVTTTYPWMRALSPASAPAGSNDVTVTVTGNNFTANSTACWSCNFLQLNTTPTTFVSSTQLTVTIPAQALQSPGTLPISIYDAQRNSFATNSLAFTILPGSATGTKVQPVNLSGLAMAWDGTRSLLYVGTADDDSAYPNSVVAVDPSDGSVQNSVAVGPNPDLLSIGAQDQFLYLAYAGATDETQLALPGLASPVTWPLQNQASAEDWGYDGIEFFAGDLKAAPQNPHTSAVTLMSIAYTPAGMGGVAVYDDQTQRPKVELSSLGYDVLAWGKTDSILLGAENDEDQAPDYALQVDASGVTLLQGGWPFADSEDPIHSDFGIGLVYCDNGKVADPTTAMVVGSFDASGLVAPDSSLNRVFIFGQTSAQAGNSYTIQSFDQTTYAPVASITVDNIFGNPLSMIRCGNSCLAVLTSNPNANAYYGPAGLLYLISDTNFVSSAAPSADRATAEAHASRDLRRRWKRLSTKDLVEKLGRRGASSQTQSR
jgi:hypothetical protein